MTVIDLPRERALRDVPRCLEAFAHDESCLVEYVFSSDRVAHVITREMRRELRRREAPCSVSRRDRCVTLINHAIWDDLEVELALSLHSTLTSTPASGEMSRPAGASQEPGATSPVRRPARESVGRRLTQPHGAPRLLYRRDHRRSFELNCSPEPSAAGSPV